MASGWISRGLSALLYVVWMLDALCDAGLCEDYVWSYFMKTTVFDGRFATPGRGLMLAGEAS